MSNQAISVSVAGTTERTSICANALLHDTRFKLQWVLTPSAKPVGRKQVVSPNPLQLFAQEHNLPLILIEEKINADIKEKINKSDKIDILLVVDFGYIVPDWLLAVPHIAPINIHPSALPRWRGSSPGQFVLLYGESQSAVTAIVMNQSLDQGDIIAQLPFKVESSWSQQEYYQYSFELMAANLPTIMYDLATKKITTQPQPISSPTPVATRLTRDDGFIAWEIIKQSLEGTNPLVTDGMSSTLLAAAPHHSTLASLISAAVKAFSPWPGIWTYVSTAKGKQRMKIIDCQIDKNNPSMLKLEVVQLEGKPQARWDQLKNTLL